MDIHSKEIRSYNMSRIKGTDTKPEILVRKYLFSKGFRYRKNDKKLPGHPDIVLPKYKTVVFIHGCFWHAHKGCAKFVKPKSNVMFWENKFKRNKQRDLEKICKLKDQGWNVLIIWECQLNKSNFSFTMENLIDNIKGNRDI